MYEGASSSASIATTSTLPLRTEPYDPFNAFGPLLDVYDALDAAAIGALKDRIEMVRPLLPFFVHARRLLSSRICSPPSPSPQVAFNLHARRFIEEKLICFPRSSTSTPRFDSVLDDFLPKPTDATSSSAAGVIDMQEDLNVSVLQHSTFHVRVVCCLAPREVHSRCHHPPFHLFAQVSNRKLSAYSGLGRSVMSPATALKKKDELPSLTLGRCGMYVLAPARKFFYMDLHTCASHVAHLSFCLFWRT